MKKPPLVSVVMNVRNGEPYLEEAVQSILDQTYHHFELIVVDDGSTDNTSKILEKFKVRDSRINIITQDAKGIYYAANNGCMAAKGKYIARFDSDDISLPGRLEKQVKFLEENPDIVMTGSAVMRIDKDGSQIETFLPPVSPAQIESKILQWNPIIQTTVMMRREAFESIGGYREIFELCGDYDLSIRLSEKFQLANIAEPLVYRRMHISEITNRHLWRHTQYYTIAQRSAKIRQASGDDPLDDHLEVTPSLLLTMGIDEKYIFRMMIEGCLERAQVMLEADHPENARQYFEKATAVARSGEFRKKIAHSFSKAYVSTYKKSGQLVRNLLIFSWAGVTQFNIASMLMRLKLRFLFQNIQLRRVKQS